MKPLSLKNLERYLNDKKYEAKIQDETQQIFVVFKIDQREFPIFIRTLSEGALLQMLTFFPLNFKTETANDVGRLLHLLNKELDTPGFGMDESAKVVFYRSVLPVVKGELADETFDAYLNSAQLVCKTFSRAIEAVAVGATSFDELLKKAHEQAKKIQ